MIITRKSSFLLLCILSFCLSNQSFFAQTPSSPFMVPDLNSGGFYHKCGFDHIKEKQMAKDPEFAEWVKNTKEHVAEMVANHQNNNGFVLPPIINIPVVVHVIHQGEAEGVGPNLAMGQIEAQIEVLNEAFSATNVNFAQTPAQWQGIIGNPEMNFCLAVLDPNGNASNGVTRHNMAIIDMDNIEDVIKPATIWNSNLYYNVWTLGIPGTTAGGGTTGYAYLPFNGTIGSDFDGSVVDWRWFGGPGFSQSGDGTLTHETGHYLGLFHTFDGDDCSQDDGLADTPNIDNATSAYQPGLNCSTNNFPTGPSSCGNEHMYVNYMDYVNDNFCSTSFSNDQITVMRAVMDGTSGMYGSRLPMANNASAVCTFFDEDCGVNGINAPGGLICDAGQITPEVEIINFGENNLNNATISYQIDGGAPVDFSWTGNLLTGESETVVLAPFTPPGGTYTFTVYTQLPNGNADGQPLNDTMSVSSASINPLSLPLFEGMEDPAWNPTINGVFAFNITGDPFEWQRTTEASGYGNGTACAMFDNFEGSGASNPGGTVDALITPIYDFTNVTGASLTFDVAYTYFTGGGQNFTDTLIILVSTNCGQNYTTQIYVKGGDELSTAPPIGSPFTPTATQWRTDVVDFSAYDGFDNVSVAFVNFSEWGNRLFIDNINLGTPCGLSSTISGADIGCFGVCDGIASVAPAGGSGTYTYQWDANAGNATGQAVTDLCAGTYSVTISDGPGCTSVNFITILEPEELITIPDVQPVYCPDVCDGVINLMTSGGTLPYTFLWSNGETANTITDLCPGPFSVTVTDGNGCTVVNSLGVPDVSTIALTVTSIPISAPGADDATATANPTGGSMPYTYAWSNSGTTQTITGLAPGTYTVTVTEDTFPFCSLAETVVIDEIDCTGFSATVSTTDETGLNANDGTATANPTGGLMPYTYLWSNAGAIQTITGLAPNTYAVTITDANGCSVIASGIVNAFVPDCSDLDLIIANADGPTCFGDCDGFVDVDVAGGTMPYIYDWSDDTYDGIEDPMTLCAGVYTIVVTDANGCTEMQSVTLGEGEPPIDVQTTLTEPLCNGDCNGSIDLSVSGAMTPVTFNWSNGATTEDLFGLCAGEYTVTVTYAFGGCTAVEVVTLAEPSTLIVSTSMTPLSAAGANDGTATASPFGGTPNYTYNWSNNGNTPTITNLAPGTYTVTVTDMNGCTNEETVVINPFDCGNFNATATSSDVLCFGDCSGAIDLTVVGGTMPYDYDWNDNAYDGIEDPVNLCAGTYEVTVTDATSCSVVLAVNITELPALSVTLTGTPPSAPGANDATITANPSGGTPGYSYLWSPTGEMSQTISNLAPGTYSVVVTDQNGCTATETITISDIDCSNFAIDLSTSDVLCPGDANGVASVTTSGGVEPYVYQWSTGDMTSTVSGLPEGTISVIVTDANGCQLDATDMVGSPLPIEIAFEVENVSCNGGNDGAVTGLASGGAGGIYNYDWSNGDNSQTITALNAAVYCVTVTDVQSGCTVESCVEVIEPEALISMIIVSDESAPGASDGSATATPSGGTPGYTFVWCNGETSATATGLPGGVCTLTITDANGCTLIENVLIGTSLVDCSSFGIAVSFLEPLCFGDANGSATATASGGTMPYSFMWSNGETTGTITGLAAGPYSCLITDALGCELQQAFDLTQPEELTASVTTTPESAPGANDGTAECFPEGGTGGYNFEWCAGVNAPGTNGLPAGPCFVIVTDANGCTVEVPFVIGSTAVDCTGFAGTVITTDVSCFGASDGSAAAFGTGGTEPYAFLWSTGEMTSDIFGLSAGTYSYTITDANGCDHQETFLIFEPEELTLTVTAMDESAPGANDGTAECFPTGGVPPYTFEWCNGSTDSEATGLPAGDCSVIVTDANACSATVTVTIGTSSIDCSTFSASLEVVDVDCFENATGVVTAFPQGGTMPYNYNWSNGGIDQSITNLLAGPYEVTITDANGCELVLTSVVAQPMALVSAASSTPETTAGANDGTASANPIGGTTPYTYAWSNSGTTETITGLMTGAYSVVVTDANGCIAESGTFVGTGNVDCSTLTLEVGFEPVSCFGFEDGFATANVNGGTAPYGYFWSTGATTEFINDLPAGPYSVTISDINGCQLVETFVISQPTALVVTATSTDETSAGANDGTASASASGGTPGYTYEWDNGDTGAMIAGLAPGAYSVTATDANGCTESMITIVLSGNVDCAGIGLNVSAEGTSCFDTNDGTATADASGGVAPYSYSWDNGGTTATIVGLTPGFYNVTITDAIGCELTGSTVVEQAQEMVTTVQGTDGACGGNASAQVFASGGTSPFTYLWSNGETLNFIGGLTAGVYSVTVTDAMGCTTADQVQVQVNSEGIIIDYDTDPISCFGEEDGGIDLVMLLGTPPYTYQWSNGATTQDLIGIGAGTYSVLIIDDAGCSFISIIEVNEPAELLVDIVTTPADSGSNGTAGALASGGTLPYSYDWSSGAQTVVIDGLTVGTYSVIVTDANGCTGMQTVTLGTTAVDDIESLTSFNLYPNPSDGYFQLAADFANWEELDVAIYSVTGQKIFAQRVSGTEVRMDVNIRGAVAGTYILRMYGDGGSLVRRVVVY